MPIVQFRFRLLYHNVANNNICCKLLLLTEVTDNDAQDDGNSNDTESDIQVSVELGRASAPIQFCTVVSVATRCHHKHAPVLHIKHTNAVTVVTSHVLYSRLVVERWTCDH